MTTTKDMRFSVPLYSVTQASNYLGRSPSTVWTWVDGRGARPRVVTAFDPARRGAPRLPFIGFAEAYVVNALRQAGVTFPRIRGSLSVLVERYGDHALASENLLTDGVEVLWQTVAAVEGQQVRHLEVPRSGQSVFEQVVEPYLRQITFEGGIARCIRLKDFGEGANVVLDPYRGSGQAIFADIGVPVATLVGRVEAGESPKSTAADYGLPVEQLRAALVATAA